MVQMAMDCVPGEEILPEESASVAATVEDFAAEDAKLQDSPIFNVVTTVIETYCAAPQQRQLITDPAHTGAGSNHRHLRTSSKARDFSVVVTGEYRPPSRHGKFHMQF